MNENENERPVERNEPEDGEPSRRKVKPRLRPERRSKSVRQSRYNTRGRGSCAPRSEPSDRSSDEDED